MPSGPRGRLRYTLCVVVWRMVGAMRHRSTVKRRERRWLWWWKEGNARLRAPTPRHTGTTHARFGHHRGALTMLLMRTTGVFPTVSRIESYRALAVREAWSERTPTAARRVRPMALPARIMAAVYAKACVSHKAKRTRTRQQYCSITIRSLRGLLVGLQARTTSQKPTCQGATAAAKLVPKPK